MPLSLLGDDPPPRGGLLGSGAPAAAPEPPDYTDRYNTALSPGEEYAYQQWLALQSAAQGRDLARDNFDYDMRGAYLGGAARSDNDHLPDTYKKPNHPTFSDQSQYHGANGQTGGSWQQFGERWFFVPSQTNLDFHGEAGLRDYLRRADPTVQLMPPAS